MARRKASAGAGAGRELLLRFGFVFAIFCVIILWSGKDSIKPAFSTPYDLYDVEATDIKVGDAVTADIDCVLDQFASLKTTNTKNGKVTSTSYHYYYIIPVFTEDDTYYMAAKVPSKYKKAFDNVADDTWAYLNYETDYFSDRPVEFVGGVKKMEKKAVAYFEDYFEDMEWFDSKSDMEDHLLLYTLEFIDYKSTRTLTFVGVGLGALAILFIVLYFMTGKKKPVLDVQPTNTEYVNNTADTAYTTGTNYTTSYNNSGAGSDTIVIEGIKYSRADFAEVDDLIKSGQYDAAVIAVRDRTALDSERATAVVQNWYLYY